MRKKHASQNTLSSKYPFLITIPLILLPLFTFLFYQATYLLNHQFFNENNLIFITDALLLRDITELSSLRLFTVFPQLPVYAIALLSYIPSLPPLIIPALISCILMALLLGSFLANLNQVKPNISLMIFVSLAIISHPLIILTASIGGSFIWSTLSSIIVARALFSSSFFHALPLVYIGWGIAIIFLMDAQFFAVIMSFIVIATLCLKHQRYFYDYTSLWLAILFPLTLMLILVGLAAYFQSNHLPGFVHGLPGLNLDFLSRPHDLLIRLRQAGETLLQQALFFPITVLNLVVLVKHPRLFSVILGSFAFPGLVAFFTVEQLRGDFSFVTYAIGPMLVSTFHAYHFIKKQYYLLCFILSTVLGSSSLFLLPGLEKHTHTLLNTYLGKSVVNPDIQEDFALGEFLKQHESVMLDYHSAPFVIARMDNAHNLVVPHTELFKVAEALKKFYTPFILIPQPHTPHYQRDRVAKIYRNIYQNENFGYAPLYNSKRWLLLKRNDEQAPLLK
jgi:hypothetical protein